ncbi:MAG TPA: SAM-dependent methyltransferase [Chthoniobacterales bacterium]
MDPGNSALVDLIRDKIARDGPVTFAWFMDQALYQPDFGYYSSGRCQIGRRGDYFTNVSVGPLFGRLLARQFAEMWELLGRPGEFTVVEQGAHHGDFARDVLEAAKKEPDFFGALRYCLVEPFPVLEARQREALRDVPRKISWRKSVSELDPFTGVHFSNELIDAKPVRLISRDDRQDWKERLVDQRGEGFAFVAADIADENLTLHVKKLPRLGETHYETEVNLAASDWIESVSRKLNRGFVLAVDYGYPRAEFYAPQRTAGTLQCRKGHRLISSPFVEIGCVDITAHVDWTSITERAEQNGLGLAGFTDQHHFLTGLLGNLGPQDSDRRALQTLLHPDLLGTRFQYLALGKGTDKRPGGFRFARDPRKTLGL